MIRFLHAADLHLDAAFRSLPPEQAKQRRAEQRALLQELAARCNEEDCDLLFLSGDLFDSDCVYRETIEALTRALAACRAQVFIAPGNHDVYVPGCPYQTAVWPENVHIFRNAAIEAFPLPALGATVYGAAFTAAQMPSLLEGFRVTDPQRANFMVLHGDVAQPDSRYDPISLEQIAASGLQYLALGHVHRRSAPAVAGKTVYAYPGCTMGRGFDELGEKGVLLGTWDGARCGLRFVPLSGRKYEILEVPAGDDALAAVLAVLPARTAQDCYRIVLTGESDPIDTQALYDALRSRFFSLSVIDRTTEKRALWADAECDTLRGLFLRACRQAMEQAGDDASRETVELAARITTALMDGREVPL